MQQSTMMEETLYSAEQIIVPEELAEILKIFTKAVTRAQPENLYSFSAQYFEKMMKTKGRVTKKQLRLLHKQLSEVPKAQPIDGEFIASQCDSLRISSEVTEAVLKKLGDHKLDWEEFIALASTLLVQDFVSSLEIMFEIFGKESDEKGFKGKGEVLHKSQLMKLLHFIAKHDTSITKDFLKCTDHALSESPYITFAEYARLPFVQELAK